MPADWPKESMAAQAVLLLRELLVRHDENAKADVLMRECVPYFIEHRPDIRQARADQAAMVAHLHDPQVMADYYANNPHERPFEQQYGTTVAEAHTRIPRAGILREWLAEQRGALTAEPDDGPVAFRVLDVACNDGWLGANLALAGYTVDGIDLHPGNIELARQRAREYPAMGEYVVGSYDTFDPSLMDIRGHHAVVCFELIEHVTDPDDLLATLTAATVAGGWVYVSTPLAAVEGGDLPRWDLVESKGHVRVYTPQSFRDVLERWIDVERVVVGPDGVMVARGHVTSDRYVAAVAALGAR